MAKQYAAPIGEAFRNAQAPMYPETSDLQEQLAGQAAEGMTGQAPEWAQEQYRSDLNAQLGSNVGAPISADYRSRAMMQQTQDWQNYYRNLGLSVAQRQPLAQPQSPQYSNYMSNFTPQSNMGFMSSTYAPFVAGSRPMMYQNQAGMPNWASGMNDFGNFLQGFNTR